MKRDKELCAIPANTHLTGVFKNLLALLICGPE